MLCFYNLRSLINKIKDFYLAFRNIFILYSFINMSLKRSLYVNFVGCLTKTLFLNESIDPKNYLNQGINTPALQSEGCFACYNEFCFSLMKFHMSLIIVFITRARTQYLL